MHPAIAKALRALHEQIIPRPEWIHGSDGIAWGLLLFVACGLAGLVASRRWPLILAGGSAFFYFLVMDRTLSSNFFRIYLVVFPVLFFGIAATAESLWNGRSRRWLAILLLASTLLGGAPLLRPAPMVPLEAVTPPSGFLDGDRYLVDSAFFHPESLIYRHPDKSFIGLPIDSDQLDAFLAAYPAYGEVLWHDRSIQTEVDDEVNRRARLRGVRESVNGHGVRYRIVSLEPDDAAPGTD